MELYSRIGEEKDTHEIHYKSTAGVLAVSDTVRSLQHIVTARAEIKGGERGTVGSSIISAGERDLGTKNRFFTYSALLYKFYRCFTLSEAERRDAREFSSWNKRKEHRCSD